MGIVDPNFPHVRTPLLNSDGTASRPYYVWFQQTSTDLVQVKADIAALQADEGSGSGNVIGNFSIASAGALPGIVTLSLLNDSAAPGDHYRYGTDGSGNKGWQAVLSDFASTANIVVSSHPDGTVTFDLSALTDSGAGTLLAITRDGYGRVTGTRAATITGTTNRVTVTNGNASAGVPTIDIASTYVGQASITTLGTIATGTWQATLIAPAYGGTGIGTYAVGDILYASGAGTLSRLAAATNGYVLTLSGGLPVWAPAGGGSTSPLTTKGDLWGFSTTNVRVPVGSTGQVLTADPSNANGVSWQTASTVVGANITPDTHPTVTNAANDEFEVGTGMDTAGTRFSGATPWTAFNTITGTWNLSQGSMFFQAFARTGAIVEGYTQPVPGATPWAYTAKMACHQITGSSFMGLMLGTSAGTAGKLITFGFNLTSSALGIVVSHWTNATTFVSNAYTAPTPFTSFGLNSSLGFSTPSVYLRVRFDGTTFFFSVSFTGLEGTFFPLYSETLASFLTSVSLIGVAGQQSATTTTPPILVADWFRRTT